MSTNSRTSGSVQSLPANKYMLKVNNRSTRERHEICSNLTIKTPEPLHWRRSGVFIANFEYILTFSSVSIVQFEKIIA